MKQLRAAAIHPVSIKKKAVAGRLSGLDEVDPASCILGIAVTSTTWDAPAAIILRSDGPKSLITMQEQIHVFFSTLRAFQPMGQSHSGFLSRRRLR